MGLKYGVTQLENLKGFRARRWFDIEFVKCGARIAADYMTRNEITAGGTVTVGTSIDPDVLFLTTTAITGVLNGRAFKLAAIDDEDFLWPASGTILRACWANGTSEATTSIDVAASTSAFVTLILTNSTGGGGVDEVDDDACGTILAVIACDPASDEGSEDYTDGTAFLTSKQIQDALDASDDHDKATGWIHLAEVEWAVASDGITASTDIAGNRNNMIQGR